MSRRPESEKARLVSLHALQVLDTPPEPAFDSLAQAAALVCDVPVSLISLVDADRQWFKANHGLEGMSDGPREQSFCQYAIWNDGLLEIPDAAADPRFADNPYVTGDPGIGFYAGMPLRLGDGHSVGTLCVLDHTPRRLDGTQRKVLEHLSAAAVQLLESHRISRELAISKAYFRALCESSPLGIFAADANGDFSYANVRCQAIFGMSAAAAGGEGWHRAVHADDRAELIGRWRRTVDARRDFDGEFRIRHADGTEVVARAVSRPIIDDDGAVTGHVGSVEDVTEQRRLSAEMSYRATHDALTDLMNRAEFEVRLQRTLDEARERHDASALMFVDLDQFKVVNDACGHSAGDRLLRQVARLLEKSVRSGDIVARLGGDEFGIILERCEGDQARRIAQQICDGMDDYRFVHETQRFRIGASIGLVPVDARWSTTAAIMQAADSSCYAAKESGRNRVHVWFESDATVQARRDDMQWSTRLERALDDDLFVLHAQRIRDLQDDDGGLHAEVLIRLPDTDGGLVSPGAFLGAAERFDLADRIDRWVLRRTTERLRELADITTVRTLCVNLSGQSIGDPVFQRDAIELLTAAGADIGRRLCLEITETAAVTNIAAASAFVDQVRSLGVRVALDDFGAGASSLGYLKRLTVDLLKIDGQFITQVIDDPLDAAAVRGFVDVAKVMGLKTVAEFVGSEDVLAHLRAIGVDYAQGFLVHEPEALDAVLAAADVPLRRSA